MRCSFVFLSHNIWVWSICSSIPKKWTHAIACTCECALKQTLTVTSKQHYVLERKRRFPFHALRANINTNTKCLPQQSTCGTFGPFFVSILDALLKITWHAHQSEVGLNKLWLGCQAAAHWHSHHASLTQNPKTAMERRQNYGPRKPHGKFSNSIQ